MTATDDSSAPTRDHPAVPTTPLTIRASAEIMAVCADGFDTLAKWERTHEGVGLVQGYEAAASHLRAVSEDYYARADQLEAEQAENEYIRRGTYL